MTTTLKRQQLPIAELLLILVAIVWGTSYGLTKYALGFVSITLFIALRFGMTWLLLLPTLFKELQQQGWHQFLLASPLGILLFCIFMVEVSGVYYTSAAKAAVLISSCILMTPLFEWLAHGTKPSRQLFIALSLCMLGIVLLTVNDLSLLVFNLGDALILIAAILRGVIVVKTKSVMKHCSLSPLAITAVQCSWVLLGSIILCCLFQPKAMSLPTEWQFWWVMFYLVLGCTLFAFVAQNYGVKNAGPSRAALLMGTEPLFGALFSVIFLTEQLSIIQWLGSGLIVSATFLELRKK